MGEFRKIIKFGGNSAIISLPKKWLKHNNIVPGDSVHVDVFSQDLLISPSRTEDSSHSEKTITYDISDDPLVIVKRKIMTAYIENYDIIILQSPQLFKNSKAIREITHEFMALEIIEETSQRIVAKCFLNMDDIAIKTILRKTDAIIKTMFAELISMHVDAAPDISSAQITERDKDVNRMTALVFRAVRYHLTNPQAKKQKEEGFPLNQWNLAHILESFGDSLKRLSRIVEKLGKQQTKGLHKLLILHLNQYNDVMTAYFKQDRKLAYQLELKNDELLELVEKYQIAFETSVHVTQAVQKMLDLSKRIKEISYLV